ncbi:hypothetical protein J8I87_15085 [Paraburkholderia sp. LEh10]|jgi:hypothetical protein|uniref:hypothetical protein n=1 Tax=Paraburkholderia sp. LEh10 TaxID=2821353 RepID=UPI001AE3CCBC|nr:hypothetical protein [Paraburkholderia sp. LEh10]MBP0591011.1 hypothetical protein [Paraburkholderia sp. LEh10]
MKKLVLFVCLTMSFSCLFAQTSGSSGESIATAAGFLTITKLNSSKPGDGGAFAVRLNGKDFDVLYGVKYVYFADVKKEVASRIIVEDYIGGFSTPPVLLLYDFLGKTPRVFNVSDSLDVAQVCWSTKSVFLQSNDRWYEFRGTHLVRRQPAKNCDSRGQS